MAGVDDLNATPREPPFELLLEIVRIRLVVAHTHALRRARAQADDPDHARWLLHGELMSAEAPAVRRPANAVASPSWKPSAEPAEAARRRDPQVRLEEVGGPPSVGLKGGHMEGKACEVPGPLGHRLGVVDATPLERGHLFEP